MRKKLNVKLLFLLLLAVLSICSCTREDLLQQETPKETTSASSAKYASRSLWKEDDVYIGKVQQVFLKHANLEKVKETYGELYWNYAMSFGQFGEKYLLVPIVKKNKVVLLMEAVRKGDRLYFYEKNDADLLTFFQHVLYSNIISHSEIIDGNEAAAKAKYVCSTRTIVIGCLNGQTDCEPVSYSQMVCEWKEGGGNGIPPKSFDPLGDPFGGGGGSDGNDDGYEYPDPPDQDPCGKVKEQASKTDFKNKITDLESKTGLKGETGYIQRADGAYTYQDAAGQTDNANTLNLPKLDLPENKNITGYFHTHVNNRTFINADGIEEVHIGIKMFSPSDVSYFMDMLKNAMEAGRPLSDVYAIMVASSGNYQIRFTGNQYQIKSFTKSQIENLTLKYIDTMSKSSDFEASFLKFINEEMNIKATNLYKMDSNGTNSEIKLNADKSKTTIECPN